MKKLFLAFVLMLSASMVMAQAMSPEEKKALKEAQNKAKKEMNDAMKLRDVAKQMQQMATPDKPCDMEDVKGKSIQAISLMESAIESGHIDPKKNFDAWFCMDEVSSFVLNTELGKAAKSEPFDIDVFASSIEKVCESIKNVIKYANLKDDDQKSIVKMETIKLAKCHMYYAYLMQFYSQAGNNAGMIEACKKYINFPKAYPEVEDYITDPNPSYAAMAFNVYYMSYNVKDYATMAEYKALASEYDDAEAQAFIEGSAAQALLAQGDTIGWINNLKERIERDPSSEQSENSLQNLLAYYASKSNAELGAFADEMLKIAPDSKIVNYGKGFSLFAENKYEEAATYFENACQIDNTYIDALMQAGGCYYTIATTNNAKISGKKFKTQAEMDKEMKSQILDYFERALPFFERVRELAPDDTNKWAYELKIIYTSLGMKDKAAELANF